tara:strand:- start:213 stop:401 length:189 start_codon:yes stop_codon:yes gene_type:complete
MYLSKLKENKKMNEKIKSDVKKDLNEKRKLKITIPKIRVYLNKISDHIDTPKIIHTEIEINI